jgi:hypothetical protein
VESTLTYPSRLHRRLLYGAFAVMLLASVHFEVAKHGTGYWQLAAFGLGPDIALLFGVGRGLARGQIHSRAVPLYNVLHRFWGPLALLLVAVLSGLPLAYGIGALVWAFHIAADRALGYGLRTPDGFQRS